MSALLSGKMGGGYAVASMEFDNVVMEISDVHKVQKPEVLPWQRHHLVSALAMFSIPSF